MSDGLFREELGRRTQSLAARLTGNAFFWATVVAVPFAWPIYAALRQKPPPPLPRWARLPAFSATDERGHALRSAELAGHPWVMDFLSLTDPANGPAVHSLEQLQYRARNLGPDFHIVSWCTDAGVGPAQLAPFARSRHASPVTWRFATPVPAEIQSAASRILERQEGGPLSAVDRFQLRTGDRLFLIDGEGWVRGTYEGSSEAGRSDLLRDLGLLINLNGR